MTDSLTPDELIVLAAYRDAPSHARIVIEKHDGQFAHGEVTKKIKRPTEGGSPAPAGTQRIQASR